LSAPSLPPLERVADVAEELARRAGALLLEHLERLDPAQVRSKDVARDLVTVADLASERALVAGLREAFPGHAIESEEETSDRRVQDAAELRWFIDPLDGTVNFVHALPVFAVSLALWRGDEALVGVVHAPRLGETFRASLGAGARLNGRPISVSHTDDLGQALLATGFPYKRESLEHSNLENFAAFFYDVRGLRRLGSAALDLCYTAAGRFDGFWELHLSAHDVAAGGLIVREAGGRVADADGGPNWLRGGSIVAAGPELFEAIRERLSH
jgi:myo-inositol-1(or 4)-monophosphatase